MPRSGSPRRSWSGLGHLNAGPALALAAVALSADCASGQPAARGASPQPVPSSATPSSSSASPSTPSPSAPLRKYSLKELRSKPCLALDERDRAALGIKEEGEHSSTKGGEVCRWEVAGQSVSLDLDVPLSFAKTMTKDGRVTQVPVGLHRGIQAEFQRICFIFVAVDDVDHLIGTTTIPDRGVSQDANVRWEPRSSPPR
ncbi:DUF3558 family protein [Nonomuraea sp. N2-4H]|uniref:DUF3558 family protein n=1 Tax=unclassified Nonomuraea TaxID=2593643 RepID=UPI003251AF68